MALFEIDESSGLPVWVQLRNRFVYLIKTGHYQPGDQLPSVRTLAAEAAINYNTVSKVYQDIERDGYIASKRGRGTYVLRPPVSTDGPDYVVRGLAEEYVRQCRELGVPDGDIVGLVQRAVEGVRPVMPRVIVGKGGIVEDEESAEGA